MARLRRNSRPAARSRAPRAAPPFRDLGDSVEIRLSACPWAWVGDDGEYYVSPFLSQQTDGYSAGKVEDAGDSVMLRGGV